MQEAIGRAGAPIDGGRSAAERVMVEARSVSKHFGGGDQVVKALRAGGLPTTEEKPVPSKIFGPRGLFATRAEKAVQREWDEYYAAQGDSGRGSRHEKVST